MVRVDFRVLDRISTADIDGAIYLDPKTFMIRRSSVWLSRTGGPIADFDSVNLTTDYKEIARGLPAIEQTLAFNHYRNLPRRANPPFAVQEYHHLLGVRFLSASPDDSIASSATASNSGGGGGAHTDVVHLTVRVGSPAGEPLAGADVALMRGLTTVVAHATSDANGRAQLDVLRDTGNFDLVVRHVGQQRTDRVMRLSKSASAAIAVSLDVAPTLLSPELVTADEDVKHRRLYIDADAIERSPSRLDDATDIVEKLRPEIATTLAGPHMHFCPGVQYLWINEQEILPELVPRDVTAIAHAAAQYSARALPAFVISALAHIDPSHIAEMHSQECTDLSVGRHESNALFITLKPGVGYDPERGSYVADAPARTL